MLPADPNLKVSLLVPPAKFDMPVKLMLLPSMPLPTPAMVQTDTAFGPVSVLTPLAPLIVTDIEEGAVATAK